MDAADRERLLSRFERGTGAALGSGLGLSIASKVITLSGGSIRLENRQDGPGLLVILTLPAIDDQGVNLARLIALSRVSILSEQSISF